MSNPRISVVIPFHWMKDWQFFLTRCLESIQAQSFKDYEIIFMKVGSMPETSNRVIQGAKGEIIKILYMDDYLAPDALQHIDEQFKGGWMASGCVHEQNDIIGDPHIPSFTPGALVNTIGSPSVVAFANDDPLLFDEELSWMLDVELYQRLYERYGFPTFIQSMDVIIGIHSGQMTRIMSDTKKRKEVEYVTKKYGSN